MAIRNLLLIGLLSVTPLQSAIAETDTDLSVALTNAVREYDMAPNGSKPKLKKAIQELAKLSKELMSEQAAAGKSPSPALIDATHRLELIRVS